MPRRYAPRNDGLSQEGRVGDYPALFQVGDAGAEGDEGALAAGPFDLEQVAGAEILDRDDDAERRAGRILAREADEIGMVIFALVKGRQRRARHGQQLAAEGLGRAAVGDLGEAGDGAGAAGLH